MMGIVRPLTRTEACGLDAGHRPGHLVRRPAVLGRPPARLQPVAYAIKGAKVVPVSGEPIEVGTVVVRDGVIVAVGPADRVEVPYDAEVIEGKGLIVYPGFIDLYTTSGQDAAAIKSLTGAGRTVNYADFALPRTPPDNRNGITPEYEVARALDMSTLAEERRKLGFTDVLVAPGGSIATGQSALVSTGGLPRRESVLKAPVALHIALRSPGGGFGGDDDGHGHDHESGALGRQRLHPGPRHADRPDPRHAGAGPRHSGHARRPARARASRRRRRPGPVSDQPDGRRRAPPPGDARRREPPRAARLLRASRRPSAGQ